MNKTGLNFQKYNSNLGFSELHADGYLSTFDKSIQQWVFHKVGVCYDDTQLILVCEDCVNPFLHWLVEDPVFDVIEDREACLCFHCFKEKYKEKNVKDD